jgi:hypothetical protein
MYGQMDDAIPLLKERLAKAEARALRAEKAWKTAKNEVADLTTALRVVSELTGESPTGAVGANAAVAERQRLIVGLLHVGENNGQSPAELFEAYTGSAPEDINIDTFRTTIWRMRDKDVRIGDDIWLVKGANGQYWKVPGTFGTRARMEAAWEQDGASVAPVSIGNWDQDDENEPPF